jgi:hypothetical protein
MYLESTQILLVTSAAHSLHDFASGGEGRSLGGSPAVVHSTWNSFLATTPPLVVATNLNVFLKSFSNVN